MSDSLGPVVQRRRLRTELRRARQEAGLTQEAVAAEMDWSLSKIIRIETGSVGISTNDLTALLRLYHFVDAARIRELVALAREARQQSWWSKYRGSVPPAFFQFIEYEAAASFIREYQPLLIPGLLQTEEYATAVVRQYRDDFSPKTIKARVEIRMMRQQLIEQSRSPLLFFILDEAVVQRLIGDENLRRAQVERLISMAKRSNVTIEIVPFRAGIHRAMGENFSILEFRNVADSDVLYFESARDAIFSHDDAEEIAVNREMFEHLRKRSLGPEGSLAYLRKIADDIT